MSTSETARQLADELGEDQRDPLDQIKLVVRKLGPEAANDLAVRAREIHAGDGMSVADGSRQRTIGGVFFQLARQELGHPLNLQGQRRLEWQIAADLAREAAPGATTNNPESSERGEATTVKITLVGRPGQIVKREKLVVTTMYNHKRPALPKQLPKMSGADVETPYTVFIAAKQWRKVADAINDDKEDRLVIEGYPFLDPDVKGICVFAKATSTVGLQRAHRDKQKTEADEK